MHTIIGNEKDGYDVGYWRIDREHVSVWNKIGHHRSRKFATALANYLNGGYGDTDRATYLMEAMS